MSGLDLSGHAPFILGSYLVSLVVLAGLVGLALLRDRGVRREIRDEIRARQSAPGRKQT